MSTLVSHSESLLGQIVDDRYRIVKVLGRGGMGVVFEAEAIRLGKRLCAIKVLLPEFTRNETVVARFRREAEVAARVKHPNVVEIFDTGQTANGLGYIAMELLDGEPLNATLKREGRLPWRRAQRILLQICRALGAAHAKGVIHRDIKPENCIRCTVDGNDDFIKVLDFGIAKLADTVVDAGERLTASNSVIGTYAYMSYEQICGEPVDHRVDIWAVGVILYELLTGRLPFRGVNQGQIWKAIASYDPELMRDIVPGVPDGVDAVVQRALAKDRATRFATVDAFASALAAVVDDTPPPLIILAREAEPPPASTFEPVDVGAETALRGPDDDDERPTQHAGKHALTELAPAEVRPVTHETAPSVVTHSTHPGRDAEPPPPREAMQTEIAPIPFVPASAELIAPEPTPTSKRGVVFVALALLLTGAAALAFYVTRPQPPPDAAKVARVDPPNEPTPPPPIPTDDSGSKPELTTTPPEPAEQPKPPTEQPKPLEPKEQPKPPEPTEQPKPPEPTERPPEPSPQPPVSTKQPAPKPPSKKVEETYEKKIRRELNNISNGLDSKKCFDDYQMKADLVVESITVAAMTGVATIKFKPMMGSTPLAKCLKNLFASRRLPKGKADDHDITFNPYSLSK